MADVFEIAGILIDHAQRVHPGEIAIIAYYGSHAKGTAFATSDLDIFYVPDEGKAATLSSQFVLDGLPYDFWPVSWKFLEEIADARSHRPWAVSASLLADARVLYHRAQEDLDRFNALQAQVAALTRPESRAAMIGRALEEFKETLFQLGQMRLAASDGDAASLNWASWRFVNSAVNCLALVNQTYFAKGWGANWRAVLQLRQKPDRLEELVHAIVTPAGSDEALAAALAAADRLAQDVRRILREAQASTAEPATVREVFSDFYPGIFEYKQKVLAACDRGDILAAAYAAHQIQDDICQSMHKAEAGFYGAEFNLQGEYNRGYARAGFPDLLEPALRGDLDLLAQRVQQLDEHARVWLMGQGVALNILQSSADLQRFLAKRDPPTST